MSFDPFETAARRAQTPRPQGIRNPANLRVSGERPPAVAAAMSGAARLEHLGLAFLITAIAGVLPLVMMLHQ